MASLRLKNISKSYGNTEVIKGVDLEISHGEFIVFVGASGCGKSTLLRMIAGLEDVTRGELFIDDVLVNEHTPRQREIAMVFQSYALYPHKTVFQNMSFGLKLAKTPKAEIEAKVSEAARMLKMSELLDRRPHQLSGGQRQRVAIGRAIVRNPKVFLFDEPLSNLDAALRSQMRIELVELHQRLGATMIYVTHDQIEAMTMASRIVIMNAGQIEQIGSPMELYSNPASVFVAGFIGSPKMNLIPGAKVPGTSAATIGYRPEDIRLSTSEGLWFGTVRLVEQLGSETLVYVDSQQAGPLVVRLGGIHSFEPKNTVWLTPYANKALYFNEAGRRI